MDFYLSNTNVVSRLVDEFQRHNQLIIAFDFDDTVYDYHKKGRTYNDVIELIRELKEAGCYLICWTGQDDLEFVKDYLNRNKIPFDLINEQAPFYVKNSRKIYANAYLDDRAGLQQTVENLKEVLTKINAL